MKQYKFKINGNKYAVDIHSAEGNMIELEVNGTAYTVEMEKELSASKTPKIVRSPIKKAEVPATGPSNKVKKVTAPLPGTILEIKIKEGDQVNRGDILLVMEAMKMENSIGAENAGVVKSISVKAGDNVLQGDVMVELG
ncbi:biotin/lipoyl-containing protein [Aureibacter tunicatorum]|uniref:Biotin carboxyl carrier protein n=1 Tax=Aureibacter tunicatorum TaxID=866807 RepID=A0AAE3XN39_9BACT|nr:biotin/lipoyl-containing protein [Aureibacter tunicatorum]MDR6238920.1 biotin carboxyl carrier protein [Aureibacter tunicatorum]BDD05153.1 acetyl-CoA carboxylase biotin carboxyl carrier protein subunit [Aureibacter tunicatorum]